MKNKISDLNDHLFAQLERLADDALTPEGIEREAKRCEAMVLVSDQVLRITALQIQAARIAQESGANPVAYLPAPISPAGPPKLQAFPRYKEERQ